MAAVGIVATVSFLSGCGGPSVTVIATNETTALRETYAFSPVDVTIPSGGTIVLKNTGDVQHDFTVENTDIKIYAGVGQTAQGVISIPPGTYRFFCSIEEGSTSHGEVGMEGTLTVE